MHASFSPVGTVALPDSRGTVNSNKMVGMFALFLFYRERTDSYSAM